ncbi:type II toxin-antitoxin system RelE/ParE family toxin [Methylobacterium sp. SI9]|uniref:type II toxin-antitoxin system RelE/ParE family toxin n=1 Tax=Methylobacterium guangdongense TaxID=3138811 RepID=UPI00313E5531
MSDLFWTPEATQDRDAIYDHIDRDNPAAAIALDERFGERAAYLIDHPMLGRPGRLPGTRELIVQRNYIIVYDVTDAAVRVLRVLHTALPWPPERG